MEDTIKKIENSSNKADACRALGFHTNSTGYRKINSLIEQYQIDISHFDRSYKNRIYEKTLKSCPVCDKKFQTRLGHKREKTTCSKSCSNSFFRTGLNNPNWNEDTYRSTCFAHHDKKCVVCGEEKVLDVHHFDEDRKNNSPENLIPLCPTHHRYMHGEFKVEVLDRVVEYISNFNESVV